MVKGVSIKFKSYGESVPALLRVIKFSEELKKHEKIVLKPNLIRGLKTEGTPVQFVEEVLKFCMENKNPAAEIFIAEGCDGVDTGDVFYEHGYKRLAEKYGVGMIDLNNAESEEVEHPDFMKFESIHYPQILKESFVISLPILREDFETGISASLDNMLGAYPARHYRGLFSYEKKKIKKFNVKHQIHDILKCKMPELAIIDASEKGFLLAGQPLEMDKQAAKLMGFEVNEIPHLKLIDETFG